MKSFKKFFQFSTLVALVAVFTVSCGNTEQSASSISNDLSKEIEASANSTRAGKAKAAAMGYKSLASFKMGQDINNLSMEDYAHLQAQNVNLVVLFERTAPWAENFAVGDYSKTGDDEMNALLEMYDLAIASHFDLEDGFSEGLVLEPNVSLEDPVEAARDVSLVDHVMMVHVKEVPAEDATDATANAN